MNHVDCTTAEQQGVFFSFLNTLKKLYRCTALVVFSTNIPAGEDGERLWGGHQRPQAGLPCLAAGRQRLASGHTALTVGCLEPNLAKPGAALQRRLPLAAAEGAGEEAGGGLVKTLQLGALFGLWYLFNIYFNIYNKQVS